MIRVIAKDRSLTGISRYADNLQRYLVKLDVNLKFETLDSMHVSPILLNLFKLAGRDLRTFLTQYPVHIKSGRTDLLHLTNQNLAIAMVLRKPSTKVVITVHDILPYVFRNDPDLNHYRHSVERYFNKRAMHAIHKADGIIADSEYTRQTMVEHLNIEAARIDVVYLGVDHDMFKANGDREAIRAKYNIGENQRVVLYVGSEAPRKNFKTLIAAVDELSKESGNLLFLKVGTAQYDSERPSYATHIDSLESRRQIRWLSGISDQELVNLYHAADVFVFPSLYEGFGLPLLEAMACGTPVITSNMSCLPEVAGDACILVNPLDTKAIIDAIRRVLHDSDLSAELRTKGLARAQEFTWEKAARETLAVYNKVQNIN